MAVKDKHVKGAYEIRPTSAAIAVYRPVAFLELLAYVVGKGGK